MPTDFDYIIVGGGTAGLVLAERLSRDPSVAVAVLEAGYLEESDMTLVPEIYASFVGADIDWGFTPVPQTHAAGQNVALPRGKSLGGTSAVNGMYFVRASEAEYDAWTTLGNPGWPWSPVNTHINVVEKFHTYADSFPNNLHPGGALRYEATDDPANHGSVGPIQVSYSNFWRVPEPVVPAYLDTLVSLGVPRNDHAADGDTVRSWQAPTTIKANNQSRSYAANAFLLPNLLRDNLVVFEGAMVTKIDLATSGEQVAATAVAYVPDGEGESVSILLKAIGRVVVTAGTYQSPKILELSGIGNSNILSTFGIFTLANLPDVGENLQDHVAVLTSFHLIGGLGALGTAEDLARNLMFQAEQWTRYKNHRAGPYASAPGTTVTIVPVQSFIDPTTLPFMLFDLDVALEVYDGTPQETQIALQRAWLDDDTVPQVELVLLPGLMDPSITPDLTRHHITIAANYMRPFSHGSVHVASSDPLALPRIDPNYLAITDFEVAVLREAIHFILDQLTMTMLLSNFIESALKPLPGMTDEELNHYVKAAMFSSWHPFNFDVPLPQGTIVDQTLKVYGTQNVYVGDAGIIPLEIGTHTMGAVYANVLMAAEIFLSTYLK